MRFAIDWDGTVVKQDGRAYEDVVSPMVFLPFAKEGLHSLKRAGHLLLLWSARASPSHVEDPQLDPWVMAGVRKVNVGAWQGSLQLNRARLQQMIEFVTRELPGVFDAVDYGHGGKPSVDRIIDDLAGPVDWREIAAEYGEPPR